MAPENPHPHAWVWILVFASAAFAALCAVGVATQSFGVVFVVGAPFICGFIIGRWVEVGLVIKVVCAAVVVGAVIFGAVTASIAGAICGVTFGLLGSIPLIAGVFFGGLVSRPVRPTGTIASVVFLAFLIPLEPAVLPQASVESVSTSRVFQMTRPEAFDRITFYEDTSGPPPRLLRIALPRPIATVGRANRVGDRPRCLYDAGYIVKEITRVEPSRRYEFKVIEQVGVEDHAVELISGSFRLTRLGPQTTRVVLTTVYRPKLTARFAWQPFEQAVIRALHSHVLNEMMRPPQ